MKKNFFYILNIVAMCLFMSSCGNGSSGSKMLNLGDIRIDIMNEEDNKNAHPKTFPAFKDLFINIFTVLPGPYEFTWTELKEQDTAMGYEQCRTQLKIRLKLNKSLKDARHYHGDEPVTEKEVMEGLTLDFFRFLMMDSEGKTHIDLANSQDDKILLILFPELKNLWGADGKIGFKENTDGLIDFCHFLFSEPGTEYELVLDCGIKPCRDIDDVISFNKGMKIEIDCYHRIYDAYWIKK